VTDACPLTPGASPIDFEHPKQEVKSDHATSQDRVLRVVGHDGPVSLTTSVVRLGRVVVKGSKDGIGRPPDPAVAR